MKKSNRLLRFSAVALLAVFCGCVDFDYVGQTFSATPDDVPIAYYTERSDVPAGKYTIIGKATLTAPADQMDSYELREYLIDQARAHGAEAVSLVEIKNVKVGLMPAGEGGADNGPTNSQTNPDNVSASGAPLETDSFGRQVTVQGEKRYRWEVEVKCLFFKDKTAVEKIMAERREKLAAYNASLPPLDEDPDLKDAPDKKLSSDEKAGQGDTTEKAEKNGASDKKKQTTAQATSETAENPPASGQSTPATAETGKESEAGEGSTTPVESPDAGKAQSPAE